jgi:hypothetical protein
MSYLEVEGFRDLVRDEETGVIVNINKSEVELARERKRQRLRQREEGELYKKKVDALESDINDIKNLLTQLLEKK